MRHHFALRSLHIWDGHKARQQDYFLSKTLIYAGRKVGKTQMQTNFPRYPGQMGQISTTTAEPFLSQRTRSALHCRQEVADW